MARPKKPTALLKLAGGFREDRHGDRLSEPNPGGVPVMPDGLCESAQEFWNRNVPGLIATGVATSADQDALERMARWWGIGAELFALPEDQRGGQWIYTLTCADRQWRDLATKFGMTPVDRTKVQVQHREERNPAKEFVV